MPVIVIVAVASSVLLQRLYLGTQRVSNEDVTR